MYLLIETFWYNIKIEQTKSNIKMNYLYIYQNTQ